MKEHRQFIKENTRILLRLLKGWQAGTVNNLQSAVAIESILDTYGKEFISQKLPVPTRKELAFWFTLYQFEEAIEVSCELKEDPSQLSRISPYQALMKKNLAIASKALRKNRALPREFYATRPEEFGGDPGEENEWDGFDENTTWEEYYYPSNGG